MADKAHRTPVVGLDFIRFFAALAVLLYHFGFKAFATEGNQILLAMGRHPILPPWWAATWWGWIGVQIFFVVSGMVIAFSATGATPLRFARGRLLRLFPALLICATLALGPAIWVYSVPPAAALQRYLATLAFDPSGPWIIGQFWTLPIEVAFYALIWLFVAARKVHRLEALAWLLAATSAAFWSAAALGVDVPDGRIVSLLLLPHGCYFALGIAMTGGTGRRHRLLLLRAICIATAAMQIRAAAIAEHPLAGLADRWIVPFAIWLSVIFLAEASLRWRVPLAHRCARYGTAIRSLGVMTYPLYLVHIHSGGPVLVALVRIGMAPLPACLAAIAASIAAALVIAVRLEPWLRMRLARWFDQAGARLASMTRRHRAERTIAP